MRTLNIEQTSEISEFLAESFPDFGTYTRVSRALPTETQNLDTRKEYFFAPMVGSKSFPGLRSPRCSQLDKLIVLLVANSTETPKLGK